MQNMGGGCAFFQMSDEQNWGIIQRRQFSECNFGGALSSLPTFFCSVWLLLSGPLSSVPQACVFEAAFLPLPFLVTFLGQAVFTQNNETWWGKPGLKSWSLLLGQLSAALAHPECREYHLAFFLSSSGVPHSLSRARALVLLPLEF